MERFEATEIPLEQQCEMLQEMIALQLPRLYQQLVAVCGEEEGMEMFLKLYEAQFQERIAMFSGKDVGEVMMAELGFFPAMGWKLYVEKREEDGTTYWYEHLQNCPPLEACRKHGLPDPCSIVCAPETKLAEQNRIGKWERLKHLASGDAECLFKICNID